MDMYLNILYPKLLHYNTVIYFIFFKDVVSIKLNNLTTFQVLI